MLPVVLPFEEFWVGAEIEDKVAFSTEARSLSTCHSNKLI